MKWEEFIKNAREPHGVGIFAPKTDWLQIRRITYGPAGEDYTTFSIKVRADHVVIDPTADIGNSCEISDRVVIKANAIIQDGCRISEGVSIGEGSRIAELAVIESSVRLGKGVFILGRKQRIMTGVQDWR